MLTAKILHGERIRSKISTWKRHVGKTQGHEEPPGELCCKDRWRGAPSLRRSAPGLGTQAPLPGTHQDC